jgi:hypothetical protein
MPVETETLRRTHAQGTVRFALGDRVLHGGDLIELCCSGGWVTGRFECDSGTGGEPTFFFSIELGGGEVSQHSLVIPEGALVRRAG